MLSVINYAETLVRPAADESTLRVAVGAIDSLGIKLLSPAAAIARDAARLRASNISLADRFRAFATRGRQRWLASFDQRVRRAAKAADIELAANR